MLNLIRKSYKKIFDKVPDPPYSYDFIMNLAEKDYPVYLKKLYKMGYQKCTKRWQCSKKIQKYDQNDY